MGLFGAHYSVETSETYIFYGGLKCSDADRGDEDTGQPGEFFTADDQEQDAEDIKSAEGVLGFDLHETF